MKSLFLLLFFALLLNACSPGHSLTEGSTERHFVEGEEALEKGLYEEALASWENVRDSYYSAELTMLAELKIAETYYLAERYAEAASAYDDFIRQYPGDERKAAATYWLGMSYYNQMLDYDQDQTSTLNALAVFKDLLRLYPEERNKNEILPMIQRCKNQLAAHEVYVGRFYLRSKFYPSAVKRLEDVLQKYPDYPKHDEAYFYLISTYLELEDKPKAEEIFSLLAKSFPGSPYIEKAQKKLEK